jgi:hypothetical protein
MRQGTAVLIMSRGMALHGAVLNPEGEPVAGAAVTQGHGRHFEGHASVKIDPDGRFAFTRRQLGKVVLTVEAGGFAPTVIALDVVPGYLPGVSPQFLPTEGSRTFDFRLQEAAEISGTIRLPDGGPAEGAEVYLVPQEGYLQLGRLGEGGHTPCQSLETRADGGYRFSAVKGNWLLVARHRLGYTETTPALYEGSHDLHLEKWTRIEGTYHIGTKPVGGCQISVSRSLRWYVPGKPLRFPYIFHELRGNTDEQGRFTIDMVPPGKGTVGPRLRTGSNWPMSHGERYTLLAGGTARVTIGGTGLPLIGKLALPAGAAVKAAWQLSGPVVKTTLKKAVRRAMTARKVRLTFVGVMQADGSFRINDVPAGDYALAVALCGPAVLGGMGKAIGSLEHRFTVPPMPGGRSDEPLGLGILTVVLD